MAGWVEGTFRIARDPRTGGETVTQDSSAFAAPTDALSIMCIDHRFVTRTIGFFNRPPQAGAERYDLVALAGASLAGVAEKLEETVPGFWQQVATAAGLHHIHRVVLLDHMKCGAYEKEFNNGNEMPPAVERAHHRDTWVKVAAEFHKRRDEGTLPPLRLSFRKSWTIAVWSGTAGREL